LALAKCIVKENEASIQTPYHYYFPRKATLKHEGNKKPDNLTLLFGFGNKVREGYEISYIQDIVDTTYLKAVYPMQLSCLDESGYDQDPTDPAESRFVKVTSGRYKGHYALDFNTNRTNSGVFATGQGVEIPSSKVTKVNISKQFDINIWFTPNTTQFNDDGDEPILWGFRDSNAGLDIGITGTNGNNNSWRAMVRTKDSTNGTVIRTGSNEIIMTGDPVYIRVKRGSDNLLKIYVNGVEDFSTTLTQSLQPTSDTMTFGDSFVSNSSAYKGQIHLIKVYCGSDLDYNDAEKMRISKPQAQIMKFRGRVRKVTSNQTFKSVVCQSNSYKLTKRTLGEDTSSPTAIPLTGTFKTILQDAVDEVNKNLGTINQFNVRAKDSFAHVQQDYPTNALGNIYETGSFLQFVNILLTLSDTIMYLTPRQNLIIEQATGHATDYVFDQNDPVTAFKITNSEDNDAKLANEIVLEGRSNTHAHKDFTPTSGMRRTVRKNIMQMDDNEGLAEYGHKLLLDIRGDIARDTPPRKYDVMSPLPCPNVRYNHTIRIKRNNGNSVALDIDTVNRNLDETGVIVKQIESHYPSGRTIIRVGENNIDYYDLEVTRTQVQIGLVDTTI